MGSHRCPRQRNGPQADHQGAVGRSGRIRYRRKAQRARAVAATNVAGALPVVGNTDRSRALFERERSTYARDFGEDHPDTSRHFEPPGRWQ